MKGKKQTVTIEGVTYASVQEARDAVRGDYYQFLRIVEEGAVNDHRLSPVTIEGVTYDSLQEAMNALGMTYKQIRWVIPARKRAVFPAVIEGLFYASYADAKRALGWDKAKIYYHARKGKR